MYAGGHSLGGAFALLMACMSCLRIQMPSDAIECYAFGAPPVLSLAEKSVARNVMEVRNYLIWVKSHFLSGLHV